MPLLVAAFVLGMAGWVHAPAQGFADRARVAMLPTIWIGPHIETISGPPIQRPIDSQTLGLAEMDGAFAAEAKKTLTYVPIESVKEAMSTEHFLGTIAGYSDMKALDRLKKRLDVDMVVAPMLEQYESFQGRKFPATDDQGGSAFEYRSGHDIAMQIVMWPTSRQGAIGTKGQISDLQATPEMEPKNRARVAHNVIEMARKELKDMKHLQTLKTASYSSSL